MKNNAIGMFAVLLMALSVLGVAYGYWTETLMITGTVATGELDVQFSTQASNDVNDLDPKVVGSWTYGTQTWSGARYDLNVASIDCKLVKDVGGPEDGDNQKIEITVSNAYPCYYGSIMFTIDNLGTIPAKIMSIKLVEISKVTEKKTVSVDLVAGTTVYVDFEGGTVDTTLDTSKHDFSLQLSTLAVGQQVPLSAGSSLPGDITIHIEEGAAEKTSYDFVIEIGIGQVNAP